MAFFKSKSKNILGVDIGTGGIKLVEFSHVKNRPQLHTYAFTENVGIVSEKGIMEDPKRAAELLKKMMKEAKTATVRAVAGLPGSAVFSSTLSVPSTSGKELKRAIEWQARKLIPLPIEEMVLDWKILADGEDKKLISDSRGLLQQPEAKSIFTKPMPEGPPQLSGKKAMRVLITGAAKSLVIKYAEFAKLAGLELLALETEIFALIRSLIGKDPSTVMLIDFGTMRTSIVVVEQGVPVLTRSIAMGGGTITRTIANTLGVSEDEAEQMKCDIQALGGTNNQEMPVLLQKVLEPLLTEIRYSVSLYHRQQGEVKQVDKIVLTGGSSRLPNLSTYLSKTVNMNTYIGDPWARVATHDDLQGVLDDIGPRFAVSVGLAMRDFE